MNLRKGNVMHVVNTRLLVCMALLLHLSPIAVGQAWSQSTDDSDLEYCFGSACHPTREEAIAEMEAAIAEMEAANPSGYAGKFVEIKSQLSFEAGRPRPLSYIYTVKPEGPINRRSSTYGTLAANSAPFYCAPSGEVAYPTLCGSKSELVQGIIDREIEPPRLSRRLQRLRGWSNDQADEVFPGSAGAGGSDGAHPSARAPFTVGGDLFDRGEDRLYWRDLARLGEAV